MVMYSGLLVDRSHLQSLTVSFYFNAETDTNVTPYSVVSDFEGATLFF